MTGVRRMAEKNSDVSADDGGGKVKKEPGIQVKLRASFKLKLDEICWARNIKVLGDLIEQVMGDFVASEYEKAVRKRQQVAENALREMQGNRRKKP